MRASVFFRCLPLRKKLIAATTPRAMRTKYTSMGFPPHAALGKSPTARALLVPGRRLTRFHLGTNASVLTPWESSLLHWWPEDHLDFVLSTIRERKVRTAAELEAAVKEPMNVSPTRNIWIHESMEDETRRIWENGSLAPNSL